MTKFIGYTPDIEPDVEGGIPDCLNIIPNDRGIKPLPMSVSTGIDTLAAACRGIVSVVRTDGGITTLAGTASNLYKLSGTSWSSIDTATLGAEERWEFTQWGNYTFAATPFQTLVYFDGTTLSSISDTIKAEHIITANGFVLVANYNDGVDDLSDGWACSAYQDATDWTPSATTQSAKGRLLDSAGEITAFKSLGAYAVAYQARSIYVGVYVGSPVVWDFRRVAGDIGVLSQGMVVATEQFHYLMGADDFYRFDGVNLIPLNSPCARRVIDTLNRETAYCAQSAWDEERGLAWWFYPAGQSTVADSYVCLHIETGRWGYGRIDVEAAVQFIAGGFTYDTIPTDWTYDTMPSYAYDSAFWTGDGKSILSIVDDSHDLLTVNGSGSDSSMTTSEIGSNRDYSSISMFMPRFFEFPDTATITIYAKYLTDEPFTLVETRGIEDGNFYFLSSALWHQFVIEMTGDYEIQGFELEASVDGRV